MVNRRGALRKPPSKESGIAYEKLIAERRKREAAKFKATAEKDPLVKKKNRR